MRAARAVVLLEAGADPQLTDVQIREPVADEALVRVAAVGICHTDVTMAARWPTHRLPMVFGHEAAGTVAAVGPCCDLRVGEQVVLSFASCGQCDFCLCGQPAYCELSQKLNMRGDGGDDASAFRLRGQPIVGGFCGQSSFATYALVRQRNAVAVSAAIEPGLAAPLGCSVQTGVGTVLNCLTPRPGDGVAVFGVGAVGLSAVMGARIAGCGAIVAVDPVAERRTLAAELGATATVDPRSIDPAAAIRDLTGGGAHAAVDTTAIPEVLATAVSALRSRGTLAIVGLGAPTAALPVDRIMGRGLAVRGVVMGESNPKTFVPHLVELWRRGELPLDKLVTTYRFDDFPLAWAAAQAGQVVKPVLATDPR